MIAEIIIALTAIATTSYMHNKRKEKVPDTKEKWRRMIVDRVSVSKEAREHLKRDDYPETKNEVEKHQEEMPWGQSLKPLYPQKIKPQDQ